MWSMSKWRTPPLTRRCQWSLVAHHHRQLPITNISQWIERFSLMAVVICSRFPQKAPELLAYQATIIRAERNYEDTQKTVDIDESKFGKRKYHRRRHVDGHWVFGGIERGSKDSFMMVVPDRSKMPIITQYIRPGSTIISDEWRAYSNIGVSGYTHLTVNHSQNFVNPTTGAHQWSGGVLELYQANDAKAGSNDHIKQSVSNILGKISMEEDIWGFRPF